MKYKATCSIAGSIMEPIEGDCIGELLLALTRFISLTRKGRVAHWMVCALAGEVEGSDYYEPIQSGWIDVQGRNHLRRFLD